MNFWRIANRVTRRTIWHEERSRIGNASFSPKSFERDMATKVDEELIHRIRYSMLKKTYNSAIRVPTTLLTPIPRGRGGDAGIGGRDDKARRRRDVEGEF